MGSTMLSLPATKTKKEEDLKREEINLNELRKDNGKL